MGLVASEPRYLGFASESLPWRTGMTIDEWTICEINIFATKLQRNSNQISSTALNNMVRYTDDMNSIKQERNSGDNKFLMSFNKAMEGLNQAHALLVSNPMSGINAGVEVALKAVVY